MDPQLLSQPVTPKRRTREWIQAHTTGGQSDPNLHSVKTGRVTKRRSSSTAIKSKKRKSWIQRLLPLFFGGANDDVREQEDLEGTIVGETEEVDLEGDTTWVDTSTPIGVKAKQTSPEVADWKSQPENYATGAASRKILPPVAAQSTDPDKKELTTDEWWLFDKINRRGTEPLLPLSWQLDFPSLPDDLFSEQEVVCFINSKSGNLYSG